MIDYVGSVRQQGEDVIEEELAFALCSRMAFSTQHLADAGDLALAPYVFRTLAREPLSDEKPFAFQYVEHRRGLGVADYPSFDTAIHLDAARARRVVRLWRRLQRIRTSTSAANQLWHAAMYCLGR
jgi:hypothetical protein